MAELERYMRQEKKSRTVAFLEQIRNDLLDLISKRYTNDDIINVLNKALKDDKFRQKYKVEISLVRGDEVRKYLNALRKEIRKEMRGQKRDGKRDKSVAKTSETTARKESDATNTSPSASNMDAKRFMPEGVDDEL